MNRRTLFDKTWDAHVIADLGGGLDLLHVDRHLVHDLGGPGAFRELERRGLGVRRPGLTAAVPDHGVATDPGRDEATSPVGARLVPALRAGCERHGIRLFDLDSADQGIVHVVGPELGLTLPGLTVLCGDSHTCTHGGIGALAWGIGTSEVVHVLATQAIIQQRPRTMRVSFEGRPGHGVEPKDLVLYLAGEIGADAGTGFAIEYSGEAVKELGVEGRMTICNLSIELGARVGMVAPDETTYAYLEGRRYAPQGKAWERALAAWQSLPTDADARFDREVVVDASAVAPQVTWGTSPAHVIPIDGRVPDPSQAPDAASRAGWEGALAYQGLSPGDRLEGLPVQHVFIGSCANGRLSDIEAAARIAAGRTVARGVRAWVVPGSAAVRRQAEEQGYAKVLREAGFEWREPGCSLCSATNGEVVPAGERCVSTSNRNFIGRQGPGARTHLVSAPMAAAAALTGCITDVRTLAG